MTTAWNNGAIVDIASPRTFRREATPLWLATACVLLGYPHPRLTEPFHYADLGCGSGFTALTVAAAFPHAEVWGFDINPVNIELGVTLAEAAGLTNIRFQEASFAGLVSDPPADLPAFDFMIADSVLSILPPEGQADLFTLFARHARAGGLVYLGYDTATGLTELAPVQTLMRVLYDAGGDTSDFAVPEIIAYLEQLRTGGAAYFTHNPVMERHLATFRAAPAHDIALTLLNRDWNPLMFADVASAMAEARCDFLGRATLQENVAWACAPEGMAALLEEAANVRIRETMQDIGARTVYRRDIFRRGLKFPNVAEHRARQEALTIAATGQPLGTLPSWQNAIPADPELYQPLADALLAGPLSAAAAARIGMLADCPFEETTNAIAMLIASGHAHPVMPAGIAAASGMGCLNAALIAAITSGEDLPALMSPLLGAAIAVSPLEALLIGALSDGGPDDLDRLTGLVASAMRTGGRQVTHNGVVVEDETQARTVLREAVADGLARRVPLFRRLGLLAG